MLQKHVDVYNWWLNNLQNKKKNNYQCSKAKFCERMFGRRKTTTSQNQDEEQYPYQQNGQANQSPSQAQPIQSKTDLSQISGVEPRNGSIKHSPYSNESLNVIYYNKRLEKNQYFKVNIVPLFLHEPFLSISFQDVSEFQNIKEKQIKEKGLSQINNQALLYMSIRLEQLGKYIIKKSNNQLIYLCKNIIFVKEIVSILSKTDKTTLECSKFSLYEIVEYLLRIFSNIKRINIDSIIFQSAALHSSLASIDLKTNLSSISYNQLPENHKYIDNIKGSSSQLSSSDLKNYDEEIQNNPSIKLKNTLHDNEQSLPVFGKDGFRSKSALNRTIPILQNVKTIQELQNQSFQEQLITEHNLLKKRISEEYAINLNQNITCNSITNIFNSTLSKHDLSYNQNNQQRFASNMSQINFSFENINNNTNKNNENTILFNNDAIDYSFRLGHESPIQLQNNKTQEKMMEIQFKNIINSKKQNLNPKIVTPIEQISQNNYQQNQQNNTEPINTLQNKEINMLKQFQIYNDKIILQQILVGLVSIFGDDDLSFNITRIENKLYKSIKFSFELYSNRVNSKLFDIQNQQQTKIEQIYGVKGSMYQSLVQKLIDQLNLNILMVSPHQFQFYENKLEIEIYYLKENLLQQKIN